MAFTKFVQVGRVVLINFGTNIGKLAVVVEILSTNRVLIDGPTTGVRRQELSLRRVTLTDIVVEVAKGAKSAAVKKAVNDAKLSESFAKTALGKKLSKTAKRENLTDFDRFKVMVLRRQKRNITIKALTKK